MSARALPATVALAGLMVASVLLLRLESADAYVAEDGWTESFGAIFLLVGAAFATVAFVRVRRARRPGWQGRLRVLAYLGLALFLLVAAGEELSWGQRTFDFGTPAAIEGVNAQGETTLHNLYGDDHGQNVSAQLFKAAWILFGVVIPLLAAAWAPAGRRLRRLVPVAPVWLALLFVFQQLLWYPAQADFRSDPGAWKATSRAEIGGQPFRIESPEEARARGATTPAGLSEVMETNIALLLAVGAGCVMVDAPRRRRRPRSAPAISQEARVETEVEVLAGSGVR